MKNDSVSYPNIWPMVKASLMKHLVVSAVMEDVFVSVSPPELLAHHLHHCRSVACRVELLKLVDPYSVTVLSTTSV